MVHNEYKGPCFSFLILSRSEAKRIAPTKPYIVISVTNPELPEAELFQSPLLRGILRLQFHDIEEAGQTIRNNVRMTVEDAKAILEFADRHKTEVSSILCQCEAGTSRSVAIAAALSRILQGEDKFFFANYSPNCWIYQTILETHALRADVGPDSNARLP